jgi:hypothetical protein
MGCKTLADDVETTQHEDHCDEGTSRDMAYRSAEYIELPLYRCLCSGRDPNVPGEQGEDTDTHSRSAGYRSRLAAVLYVHHHDRDVVLLSLGGPASRPVENTLQ